MAQSVGKILLLLAASNTSRSELRAFANWIYNEDPDALGRAIDSLRDQAGDAPLIGKRPRPVSSGDEDNVLRDQVESLLIKDARLTKVQAAALLREAMIEDGALEPSFLPWNSGSFGNWLNKVARATSPSEVMHFASRLRQGSIGSGSSAWPLKPQQK